MDYNYDDFVDDLAIQYPDDYCDTGHLNYYGSLKFSAHLGGFLKENYELPDRREDKDYQNWNEDLAQYYIQNLKAELSFIDNELHCNILGYEDIDNPNIAFRYNIYRDGERVDISSIVSQSEYIYEVLESGTYKVRVYAYDDRELISKFNALSDLEVVLPD